MITNEETFDQKLARIGELYEEGKDLMIKLLPPHDFGESYDAEALFNILKELRDIAAVNLKANHEIREN